MIINRAAGKRRIPGRTSRGLCDFPIPISSAYVISAWQVWVSESCVLYVLLFL